jgi:hypothetical protein
MKIRLMLFVSALAFYGARVSAQISPGIFAGVNIQNITGKNESGNDLDNSVVPAFNIGARIDFPVADDFYFQTGLTFASKGGKNSNLYTGQSFTQQVRLYYLELPLHFMYKPLLGTGHLILGLGPYFGYAVSGSASANGSDNGITFKSSVMPSDSGSVYYKPWELGANLFAGYEFSNKISFQLNAQLGLTDINPSYESNANNKTSIKNTGFGLSLGYAF